MECPPKLFGPRGDGCIQSCARGLEPPERLPECRRFVRLAFTENPVRFKNRRQVRFLELGNSSWDNGRIDNDFFVSILKRQSGD
jgi:hypothetical protein